MKSVHWIISLFIVMVIGLHVLPLLQELSGKRQTLWPIMVWGMYRYAHPSDKKINARKIYISARTESGDILEIAPIRHPIVFNFLRRNYKKHSHRVPLAHYGYKRLFVEPMWQGNKHAAIKLANLLNQDRQDRITHIHIQTHFYNMGDAGIEKVGVPVITYKVHHE
jgi:hypothetical protein